MATEGTETERLLQKTLDISYGGNTYVFRIPSFEDEVALGMRSRQIRRRLDPDHDGSSDGIDVSTAILVRTAAVFEVLLEKATDMWPYSAGDKGEPVVNFSTWPRDRFNDAFAVGMRFEEALARFRQGGLADDGAGGEEAVASEPNP